MIDSFIVHLTVCQQLREGALGTAVDGVAKALHAQGYAATTIRTYLRNSARFGQWLTQRHISIASVTPATIDQYLQYCGRLPSGRLPKAGHGFRQLVTLLQRQALRATVGYLYLGDILWTGSRTSRTVLRRVRRQFRQFMCPPSNSPQGSQHPSPRTAVYPTCRSIGTGMRELLQRRRRRSTRLLREKDKRLST